MLVTYFFIKRFFSKTSTTKLICLLYVIYNLHKLKQLNDRIMEVR